MRTTRAGAVAAILLSLAGLAAAQPAPPASSAPPASAGYDEALAARFGADDFGMRRYVLVILKTGPTPMAAGAERDAMFRGHFANMKRLSDEGRLVLAGPLDGVDGRRGLFVFAVPSIEEARTLAASDPVLESGEMVAEYHRWYGSAALVGVREVHGRLARKAM